MIPTFVMLAASLTAQAAEEVKKPDPNLDYMRSVVSAYRFNLDGDRSGPLRLRHEPAFRMGKQAADDVLDGAIFFWEGDQGRPEAAVQVFRVKDSGESGGHWVQEFISLSPGTFATQRDGEASWAPRRPGAEFRPVPGAPRPTESAAGRSRQMHAIAEEFRVSDDFKGKGWSELRLLPKPIARYGKPDSDVVDAGLFAFALGTDPEAFLFLEARAGSSGLEWHYAFAPMSCFELRGTHRGARVWDVPWRKDAYDPSEPYFVRLD